MKKLTSILAGLGLADSVDLKYDKVIEYVQEGDTASLFKDECFTNFLQENALKTANIADRPTFIGIDYDSTGNVTLSGNSQFEWAFPETNDVKLYEMLLKQCPDMNRDAAKNIAFEGVSKNQKIDETQQVADSLSNELAFQRDYFGKMTFSAGAVIGSDNVLVDGKSAYSPFASLSAKVSAPIWTIADKDLKRHRI
jgi:hypothetical protein